jgi:hypothetical protein
MFAFALPAQINEATGRRPVSERSAGNRRACFVSFNIESEIEIARVIWRRKIFPTDLSQSSD